MALHKVIISPQNEAQDHIVQRYSTQRDNMHRTQSTEGARSRQVTQSTTANMRLPSPQPSAPIQSKKEPSTEGANTTTNINNNIKSNINTITSNS